MGRVHCTSMRRRENVRCCWGKRSSRGDSRFRERAEKGVTQRQSRKYKVWMSLFSYLTLSLTIDMALATIGRVMVLKKRDLRRLAAFSHRIIIVAGEAYRVTTGVVNCVRVRGLIPKYD